MSSTSCDLHWNPSFPFTAPHHGLPRLLLSQDLHAENSLPQVVWPQRLSQATEVGSVTLILVSYKSKAGIVGTTQPSVAASQGWGRLNHISNNTFFSYSLGSENALGCLISWTFCWGRYCLESTLFFYSSANFSTG